MQNEPGHATGGVAWLLRAEGLCLLTAAVQLYARSGSDWRLFAALFLVPDLSFLAYLAGPRAGAAVYNCAHSLIGPLALAGIGLAAGSALPIALIWTAHIGFDRALGYGLKYADGFSHTHLGRAGGRTRVAVLER